MGLVVGARWLALGTGQGHITEAADQFAASLFDPALGACEPVLGDVRVVHDPTLEELDAAFQRAFVNAAQAGATLAIGVVGHGYRVTSGAPYYFVPSDHPDSMDRTGNRAYSIAERIRSLNAQHPGIDGLILLIDACGSGELWREDNGKGEWQLSLPRLALRTATDTGPAWGARFTRIVSEVMESGVAGAGNRLLLQHFDDAFKELRQKPGQAQPTRRLERSDGPDGGLWIAINRADRANTIAMLAYDVMQHQGLNRITSRYQRPEIPDLVSDAVRDHRAVAVLGPSGCGKSATLQMITIDKLDLSRTVDDRPVDVPWQAVAFFPAAADSTVGFFVEQVRHQLGLSSSSGYEQAVEDFEGAFFAADKDTDEWNRLPETERLITGPMRHLPDGASVVLVVDGLDQLPESGDGIIRCLSELAALPSAGSVHIVVSARHRPNHSRPRLPDGFLPVTMPDPSSVQIRRYLQRRRIPEDRLAEVEAIAAGNWLIITLLGNELTDLTEDESKKSTGLPRTREGLYNALLKRACAPGQPDWHSELAPVMAVLACAGAGVALPLSVLCAASGGLGGPDQRAGVHDAIVALHRVLERIDPGTDDEQVMLIHPTLVEHLASSKNEHPIGPLPRAHSAVAAALATLAPMAGGGVGDDAAAREYANRSEATHRWEAGDYEGAVDVLVGRPSDSVRDNRDRWAAWTERIADRFGPVDILTLRSRQQLAYWTSRSGLYADALSLYRDLVPDLRSARGNDDVLTLRVAFDEATCIGVNGSADQARERLLLLAPAIAAVVGPFDALTLEVRNAVGSWTGLDGDPHRAVALLRPVLDDCEEHLGAMHPETLSCRSNLARWTAESGQHARAVEEYRALLPAQLERLGPKHRETLRTRYSIAYFGGEAGRPAEALALMEELIVDQTEALGAEHPDTLRTEHGIGVWSGINGNPAKALRVLAALLPVRERVLGRDHADTLRTLNNLGRWTGTLGRHAEAITILEDTLERRTRKLGPDNPDTLRTVNNIVDETGAAGDYQRAWQLASDLVLRQQGRLGDTHKDTLLTRFNAALWLAKDGSVATALEQLRALYPQQVEQLGAEHPNAQRTAALIEELSSEAG
jgi:hypothetical protein